MSTNVINSMRRRRRVSRSLPHSVSAALPVSAPDYGYSAADNLLVVYNSNIADSVALKNYYLANRPGVSSAMTLGLTPTLLGSDGVESITNANVVSQILTPIADYIVANSSKQIKIILLLYGLPTRITDADSTSVDYRVMHALRELGYSVSSAYYDSVGGSVATTRWNRATWESYQGTTALVSRIDGRNLADCEAYIDKVAAVANASTGILSAGATSSFAGTGFFFDANRNASYDGPLGEDAEELYAGLLDEFPTATATLRADGTGALTTCANVRAYWSWGTHNDAGWEGLWPTYSGRMTFTGQSGWHLFAVNESFCGRRESASFQSVYLDWFAANSFGGTAYSNTPAGAIAFVDEPNSGNIKESFFAAWQRGYTLPEVVWGCLNAPEAICLGDPFVTVEGANVAITSVSTERQGSWTPGAVAASVYQPGAVGATMFSPGAAMGCVSQA